jgi:hypothetical protein
VKYERARLEALGATDRALRRDACGDWAVKGKRGRVYADGSGFLIVVVSARHSIRRWINIKRKLAFCHVTQDGDHEGCLHLDHLPTPKEADLIRHALGIKPKRRYKPDQLADLIARLKKKTTRDPRGPHTFVKKRKKAA